MEYPINVYKSQFTGKCVKRQNKISALAKKGKWSKLLDKLEKHKDLINSCRLSAENGPPPKLYTPLHQAAEKKAPKNVIQKLLDLGSSRTLKTADGETAYDIGKRVGLSDDVLKHLEVPEEIREKQQEIQVLEEGLHKAINGRLEGLLKRNGQQLPQLSLLYEFGEIWYPIPGFYGGFRISKHEKGVETLSWCRVWGGSGQRHVIDRQGKVELVEEGFD